MPVITARFVSQCPACGGRIEAGSRVNWEKGSKATHETCGGGVAVAERPAETAREWSAMQQAIFDATLNGSGNILVEAGPGCAKTTSSVEDARRVKAAKPGASIVMCAFNASIAGELKQRVPQGVEAATFHSIWFRALSQHIGTRVSPDKNKVRKLATAMVRDGQLDRITVDLYLAGAVRLVAAAKSAGIGVCIPNTPESWVELQDQYDIEFDGPSALDGVKLAERLLEANNACLETIDFDDMLYLSAIFGVQCQRYDYVFVDESQDFTPLQLHLLHRMLTDGGKLIAVGDKNQSIYLFRGAASNSMDQIRESFDCTVMPLNTSYRCAKAIVREAQAIAGPESIEAGPNNPEGLVEHHGAWSLDLLSPTDAVLCRNTAPLVRLAYRCIAARIPVRMTGREIGDGLVGLIRKLKPVDIDDLQERLSEYGRMEITRLTKRLEEEKAAALQDKIDSINTAISNLTGERTIEALIMEIEEIFEPKPEGMLTISTVHRAKGSEYPNVWILDAHLMPSRYARTPEQIQQERNVQFVAVTRAQKELHYIDSGLLV